MQLDDFPLKTYDKIRYRDTDRQGHVNNAVYSTYLETARAELVYGAKEELIAPGCSYVIASVKMDYLKEVKWPGRVDIGTAVTKIGNSSIGLSQSVFQDGELVLTSESVIVHVGEDGKSRPLSEVGKKKLESWLLAD